MTHPIRRALAVIAVILAIAAVAAPAAGADTGTSAPINTAAPVISGNIRNGWLVNATPGVWDGAPTSYAYQWQRCATTAPDTCTDIAGAVGSSYLVDSADFAQWLRVNVTATNDDGSGTASSAPAGPVVSSPLFLTDPAVNGQPFVGSDLTLDPGTWFGTEPIGTAIRWWRCDHPIYPRPMVVDCGIVDINTPSYTVADTDLDNYIYAEVTINNGYGSDIRNTAFTAQVVAGPVNTTAPTVTGATQVGATVTADPGTWAGTTPLTYTYQWQRCTSSDPATCTDIDGATATTRTLDSSDLDTWQRVTVTAANTSGTGTASSAPVGPTAGTAPVNTTAPTVTGATQVGATVTADPGTFAGAPAPTVTGTWERCSASSGTCEPIAGATDTTYTIGVADLAAELRYTSTATNSAGVTTSSSERVGPVVSAPTVDLTSAGTVAPGGTVTVAGSGFAAGSNVTFTLYSTPQPAGTATVAGDTTFTHTATIPAGTPAGAHRLVGVGTALDGSTVTVEVPINVADTTVTAPPTASPTVPTGAAAPPAALLATTGATTGATSAVGLVLLAAGTALVAFGRRRPLRRNPARR
jgi:hypothetical protein